MIVLVLLLPLLALFAFENEHVAEHRYVDVLGVDTRQLDRDLVHLLVLTHVDRRRRKAERTAPRRFGRRTSGAAKGSRTRCRTDRTADPSRHGRTAIHRGSAFFTSTGTSAVAVSIGQVERKRVHLGHEHQRDIDPAQFIPPLHPIAAFASPGGPARWRAIPPLCVAMRRCAAPR